MIRTCTPALLLLADSLRKAIFCESDELFAESLGPTGFQSLRQITPCHGVMARDRRSREFFDGTWSKSVGIEVNFGELILGRRLGDRQSTSCNNEARSFDELEAKSS